MDEPTAEQSATAVPVDGQRHEGADDRGAQRSAGSTQPRRSDGGDRHRTGSSGTSSNRGPGTLTRPAPSNGTDDEDSGRPAPTEPVETSPGVPEAPGDSGTTPAETSSTSPGGGGSSGEPSDPASPSQPEPSAQGPSPTDPGGSDDTGDSGDGQDQE